MVVLDCISLSCHYLNKHARDGGAFIDRFCEGSVQTTSKASSSLPKIRFALFYFLILFRI